MQKRRIIAAALVCFSGVAFADDIQLMGTITQRIKMIAPMSQAAPYSTSSSSNKIIPLLAVKLSDTAQSHLLEREQGLNGSWGGEGIEGGSSSNKQLQMNGLPVLDQGMHGTCVTFAVTAALDAALGGKDEISQLCSLELGNYLEQQSYAPSGWEGSFGHTVLNQIDTFGVVSKAKEASQGCGGLTDYPLLSTEPPSSLMTPETFHEMSKDVSILWHPILHVNESLSMPVNTQQVLAKVKSAIEGGDRVVFGSLLAAVNTGIAGAVGTYHVKNDTWILTSKIREALKKDSDFAAHEMVIIGYDDYAKVTDQEGQKHTGLLTLRNSWGDRVGDHGNFYMSYDYFKALVIEAHRIQTEH